MKLARIGYYFAACSFIAANSNLEGWQVGCMIGLLFIAEIISFEDGFNIGWDSCHALYTRLIKQEIDKLPTNETPKQ